MKITFILLTLLASVSLKAQYYYNDIVGSAEINQVMKNYILNKVSVVTGSGTDPRGMRANNFSEYHEVKENGKALRSVSITGMTRSSSYSSFDEQGRISSLTDSSNQIVSVTNYTYDAAGKLTRVQNSVSDSTNDFNQTETHDWIYNAAGKPEKMWRIISVTGTNPTRDSLEIRFTTDEDGNTAEERTFKRGIETGYLYYYYDDDNRLSDIVRYNAKVKKLLPDLMFEYDDQNRVIQKITTTTSINMGYLTWRYIYNDKGLKTMEALFDKDKQLTGKIAYSYKF